MSLTFHPVDRHQVGKQWPKVRKWISRACAHSGGLESVSGLRKQCADDPLTELYLIRSDGELVGAVIMELHPKERVSHVTSLGGEMPKGWVPDFFGWWRLLASVQNVRTLRLRGRKGWRRITAPYGFRWNDPFLEFER